MGSLIKQLVLHKISAGCVPNVVEELYQKSKHTGEPDLGSLVELLRKVTELFTQVYIVADGIDELEKGTLQHLHNSAKALISQNKTKFLISSRYFTSNITSELRQGYRISVQPLASDVWDHLKGEISRNESLEVLIGEDPIFINTVISDISQQCQGQ